MPHTANNETLSSACPILLSSLPGLLPVFEHRQAMSFASEMGLAHDNQLIVDCVIT